jgi:hypothetical protein
MFSIDKLGVVQNTFLAKRECCCMYHRIGIFAYSWCLACESHPKPYILVNLLWLKEFLKLSAFIN